MFGPSYTTKIHQCLEHFLDEFVTRGNEDDANTGANEALHKAIKKAFQRTNKTRRGAALQMVLAEQIATQVHASAAIAEERCVSADAAETRPRLRARGPVASAAKLSDTEKLPGLHDVLHCSASDRITTQQGAKL